MAHEVKRYDAIFTTRVPSWHGVNNTVFAEPMTNVAEALRAIGLDWEVGLGQLLAVAPGKPLSAYRENGHFHIPVDEAYLVPTHRATIRSDMPGEAMGCVGNRYVPLQQLAAFGPYQPLLDAGAGWLETGGSIRNGRDVWMLMRLNLDAFDNELVKEVYGEEGILPYALITNNHSGWRKAAALQCAIIVVCGNTFRAATSVLHALREAEKAVEIRHTGDVGQKMDEAVEQLFARFTKGHIRTAIQLRLLRAAKLNEKQWGKLVLDAIAPLPKKQPATKRQETGRDRVIGRRNRLTELWQGDGDGVTGDGSAYEGMMAVTQGLQHDPLFASRGDELASLFDGTKAVLERRAIGNLLGHVLKATEGKKLMDRLLEQTDVPALDRILAQA